MQLPTIIIVEWITFSGLYFDSFILGFESGKNVSTMKDIDIGKSVVINVSALHIGSPFLYEQIFFKWSKF